jgi:hypothetical protein
MKWPNTKAFLSTLRDLLTVQARTVETHETGLVFAERYNLSIYDAMIAASAFMLIATSCDGRYAGWYTPTLREPEKPPCESGLRRF